MHEWPWIKNIASGNGIQNIRYLKAVKEMMKSKAKEYIPINPSVEKKNICQQNPFQIQDEIRYIYSWYIWSLKCSLCTWLHIANILNQHKLQKILGKLGRFVYKLMHPIDSCSHFYFFIPSCMIIFNAINLWQARRLLSLFFFLRIISETRSEIWQSWGYFSGEPSRYIVEQLNPWNC